MSDTVIQVETLSKRYRLGVVGTGTLSHDLNRWWAKVRGRPDPTLKVGPAPPASRQLPVDDQRLPSIGAPAFDPQSPTSEYMWALKHVSFEVRRGESLGIIGGNGAGKSTVLKILSRVTAPTSGEVRVRGRIASLLEVGTGFHPELTGRENIILNGAILGMSKAETSRKFDDIVAFSGVEQYIDTPVKRYSSGMYVRLGFSVAVHVDPEILIVDEVLAVGDAEFQKKCLGKMGDIARGGRTVLFVSHNMQAVRSLCTHAIELDAGKVANEGEVGTVVDTYLRQDMDKDCDGFWRPTAPLGDDAARLVSVRLLRGDGRTTGQFLSSEQVGVEMVVDVGTESQALCIGFDLGAGGGGIVFRTYQTDAAIEDWPPLEQGRNRLSCAIPAGLLNQGRYRLMPRLSLHNTRWIVHEDSSVVFDVVGDHAKSPYAWFVRPGLVAPVIQWEAQSAHAGEVSE